jgi:hypothetical protein
MTIIQIQKPELEALILDRMQTGKFENIEDFLLRALRASPLTGETLHGEGREGTGADLVAAMQASPYKEIDIEPTRERLAARDVKSDGLAARYQCLVGVATPQA